MQKINFEDYPSTNTPIDANNLNDLQDNVEEAINLTNTYSTNEIKIGTWLGKPLYRKVIDFGALPNATTKNVSLNINDLDEVINFYARTKSGTTTRIIPTSSPVDVSYNMDIYINGTNITINTGTDRSSYTAYVVVEYTKTTDTVE